MPVRAVATNTGYSVKKIKPIIDMIRGMKVEDALDALRYLPSPIASQVAKVVSSAAANGETQLAARPSDLRIIQIYADEGTRLKRYRARARGRVGRITRRSSHITVIVDEDEEVD